MSNYTIKHCKIAFRNFRGVESDYNPAGARNFNIILDESTAKTFKNEGFNVKVRPGRNDGDEDQYFLKVNVSYRYSEPTIFTVSDGIRARITEDNVDHLDKADVDYVNITITKSHWQKGARQGESAYLKTLYVYLNEDELDKEWADSHGEYEESEESPF